MQMPRYIQRLSNEMESKGGFASVSILFNEREYHWRVSVENTKTGAWACHLIPESVCRRYGNSSPETISSHISEVFPAAGHSRLLNAGEFDG
ncbi:MAG: hypothetical protein EOP86_05480 [Verrucomicrobiaceae bacterium]|nr:MAG: hypothetical protein EOP86_05480 [Verrucomicrobiaceae bacterium]